MGPLHPALLCLDLGEASSGFRLERLFRKVGLRGQFFKPLEPEETDRCGKGCCCQSARTRSRRSFSFSLQKGLFRSIIRSPSTEVSLDYFGYRCVDAVRVFISVYSTLLMHEKNKLCVPSLVKIERGGGKMISTRPEDRRRRGFFSTLR